MAQLADSEQFIPAFKETLRIIESSKRVLLATHEHPDADGLGSMLAIHSFLKARGAESIPFSRDLPGEKLAFLPGIGEVTTILPEGRFDAVIGFDYGDFFRLGLPEAIMGRTDFFITFDHHLTGETRGDVKIIDPAFSSTSEIVYLFFTKNNIPIGKEEAILILAGVIADTGGFQHVTTSPAVYRIASDLLAKGILPTRIAESLLADTSPNSFQIWGRALARLSKHPQIDMAYSFLTQTDFRECDAEYEDASGVIAVLNTVSEASFSLILVEVEEGRVKGSLRSEPYKGVDVSDIAKRMGGGGHKYAAGFSKEGSIKSVLEELEELVDPKRMSKNPFKKDLWDARETDLNVLEW